MKRFILLALTHLAAAAAGFAAGIYFLPILIAPSAPSREEIAAIGKPQYTARFRKDLKGSDLLHWGEGELALDAKAVTFTGRLAPGPDYKLYLAPEFVDTKEGFLRIKPRSLRIGDRMTLE